MGLALAFFPCRAEERVLRAAVLLDFPPLYGTDPRGKHSGLALDVMEEVSRASGFRTVMVPVRNWEEAKEAVRSGMADFVPGIGYDNIPPGEFVMSSVPMESVPVVIWARKGSLMIRGRDDLPGRRVAVISGGAAQARLALDARIQLEAFPDADAAILPLLAGQIDAFVCPEPMLRAKLRELSLGDRIKAVGDPLMDLRRGYLFPAGWEAFVRTNIDPQLEALVRSERYRRIYQKWYGEPAPPLSLRQTLLLIASLLSALILGFSLVWGLTMRKKNRLLARRLGEQRAAERAMRESEEHYRTLFEKAPMGIALAIHPDLRIESFNDTFASLFGFEQGDAPSVADLHPAEDLPQIRQVIEASRSGIPAIASSASCIRKDGSSFLCDIATTPITIGGRYGAIGFFQDVSERECVREELRQREKLSAIGQLAGGIAHDFNNQLAGIMGFAEILSTRLADRPDDLRFAGRIIESAGRAAELTGKLLAFARKGKYEERDMDLRSAAREAAAMAERSFDRRISIETAFPDQPATIRGSAGQMQNAILNLLLNARDAMPEGGVIKMELDRLDLDGRPWRRLKVVDNGTGMTPEVKTHAFEPFFTTKPAGKGTGMGLAAVYGTVKNHGGSVDIESEAGKGSAVTILLPAIDGPADDESPSSEEALAQSGDAAAGAGIGKRVLLVEDEEALRSSASLILAHAGYAVDEAGHGRAALDALAVEGAAYDLVILDMIMPGMGGAESFERIHEAWPDLPVILSSGYSIDGVARSLLEHGAKAFLQKPFTRADLLRAVHEALRTVP